MIDNVILLTLGTLHERDTHELLERCHPLGVFDTMPALCVATNVEELYHSVIVETPLGWSSLTLFLRDANHRLPYRSSVLPGLSVGAGSGRPQYRNHSKHPVQILSGRLQQLLPDATFPNERAHVSYPRL
jgi:hypothetical protein